MNPPMIFVFGSNLSGIHGAGAACVAVEKYGAILRRGVGRQGNSWAIPTKDFDVRTSLPLNTIKTYVDLFLKEARADLLNDYQVTQIGCGLAGFQAEQIAPMFKEATSNVLFDLQWAPWLRGDYKFWGTF